MIQNASFRRKVVYLGLIALLLIPLYVVGHPAVGDPTDPNASPGGRLAQLRAEYDLSPAEIGEIDPTSESMKLATLGMRGVAATVLWSKANDYKKKENWEGLVAVVNQMAKLQPNFISVWEFQSHNLSYNISVEQDDYRFRYLWVKKGIEFLIQGTHYNRREPKLYWTVGWYTGQKFNRADESKQFRRLFRTDQDFHALQSRYVDVDGLGRGADGRPDSWLVSRLWYHRAYDIVDTQDRPIRGKSPHIFYADGPKAQMNYAGAIEDEGILDERAEYAWKKADEEWTTFGDRSIPTTNGLIIRLNDEEKLLAEAERITAELDELSQGARQKIIDEKKAKLSPRHLEMLDMPFSQITEPRDFEMKMEAITQTSTTHEEVAGRAPAEVRAKAYRLAKMIVEASMTAEWIARYRENVNFKYWRTRCRTEQLSDTVAARRHIYTAAQLKDKVELDAARKEYEKAWDLWAKVIDQNPGLLESLTADDLYEYVESYVQLLSQLDEELPADFKLRKLIEHHAPPEGSPEAAAAKASSAASETTSGSNTDPSATSQDPNAKKSSDDGKESVKNADAIESEKKTEGAEDKPTEPATKSDATPDKAAQPEDKPTEKPAEPADKPAEPADKPNEPTSSDPGKNDAPAAADTPQEGAPKSDSSADEKP